MGGAGDDGDGGGGVGGDGDSGDTHGGGAGAGGEGGEPPRTNDAPTAGDVLSVVSLDAIRSPHGLTGPLGQAAPLWAGDFIDDEVVTAPAGTLICSLPDVGMGGLTRLDDGSLITLHDDALFVLNPANGCASRRLISIDEGADIAWDGTDLLHLKRTWLLHRDPATGGERRQRTLNDPPWGAHKMAAIGGLLFLVGARPSDDGSGFVVPVAVYDLTSVATVLTPTSSFDLDIDASDVSGVHASREPDRLWLLTSGSGPQAGSMIEVALTRSGALQAPRKTDP